MRRTAARRYARRLQSNLFIMATTHPQHAVFHLAVALNVLRPARVSFSNTEIYLLLKPVFLAN